VIIKYYIGQKEYDVKQCSMKIIIGLG